MKLKMPFKVPKAYEAKEAVSKNYWKMWEKKINSKAIQKALKAFFKK